MGPTETIDDDREDQALLDRGEVGRVLARHHAVLVQRARTRLHGSGRAAEADDVVQEAELRLVRQLAVGLPAGMPARACLHQYLRWAIQDLLARGHRDRRRWGERVDLDDVQERVGRDGVPSARHMALVQLLRGWAGRDGLVARAVWLDGLAPGEVADRLGMSANAVHQAASRVRTRLRREGLSDEH